MASRIRVVRPARFREWLKSKGEHEKVGSPQSPCCCPVAEYLRETFGGAEQVRYVKVMPIPMAAYPNAAFVYLRGGDTFADGREWAPVTIPEVMLMFIQAVDYFGESLGLSQSAEMFYDPIESVDARAILDHLTNALKNVPRAERNHMRLRRIAEQAAREAADQFRRRS